MDGNIEEEKRPGKTIAQVTMDMFQLMDERNDILNLMKDDSNVAQVESVDLPRFRQQFGECWNGLTNLQSGSITDDEQLELLRNKANVLKCFVNNVEHWIEEAPQRAREEAVWAKEVTRPEDSVSSASSMRSRKSKPITRSSSDVSSAATVLWRAELERMTTMLAKSEASKQRRSLEERENRLKEEENRLKAQRLEQEMQMLERETWLKAQENRLLAQQLEHELKLKTEKEQLEIRMALEANEAQQLVMQKQEGSKDAKILGRSVCETRQTCIISPQGLGPITAGRYHDGAGEPAPSTNRYGYVKNGPPLKPSVYKQEAGGHYGPIKHDEEKQAEIDVRSCCLMEIKQTEEKYTETLVSIEKYFRIPLKQFFSQAEIVKVFGNIPELVKVHKQLVVDLQDSISNRNALNLHQIFISYKQRLLIYGEYCSHVENAIEALDLICKEREDVRLKLEECSKRANNGKFKLRDLLVLPMQRVLKYHLLLQELVKHTRDDADRSSLTLALNAMKDLAQYVNEVKRDNETLKEIYQYQSSIENLNQPLISFGRPKGDGEVRMMSSVDKRKQDRYVFLFDEAAIVCKRRGDNYEMKDIMDLNVFKITDNPTSDREDKKWSYGFYVTHQLGLKGFELFFKTRELKKKWLDQFKMAISNIRPEKANHNSHQFRMHTFASVTSCSCCHLLLRGIFNQGYLCLKCGLGAHKECLGRLGACGRTGLPRMVAIKDYSGSPCPKYGTPLSVREGDVIELMFADPKIPWWQGKILATSRFGFFPSDAVRPFPCAPKPVDYSAQLWFAGPMERFQAEIELKDRGNGTFLVRHRRKECNEYAISIKFHDKVKHIRIPTKDGCFHIAERGFKSVLDLVEYYKQHSLKEAFCSLDSTLQVPYRELANGNVPGPVIQAGSVFSPRVVGNAVARYDFCSRDTRELSLLKGDAVKIHAKMSNGWWKGEIEGRVGWFPSTYVEEED